MKIKFKLILLTMFLYTISCIPDMTPIPRIIKEVDLEYEKLKWSNNSSAYANAPDMIIIYTNNLEDTICVATNISDIQYVGGYEIKISFYGKPRKYKREAYVKKRVNGYKIILDTLNTL